MSANQNTETSKTTGLNNHACACGCKFGTLTPTATYLPGHDARHVSNLLAAIVQSGDLSQANVNQFAKGLPSMPLQQKLQTAVDNFARRQAAKKAPKKSGGTWMDVDHTVAKIGRWEYPVQEWVEVTRTGDAPSGQFQRNTKRDGSGEWVPVDQADLIDA